MIKIDLKLFVTLLKYLPDSCEEFQIKTGTTVDRLIAELGLLEEQVKLIFINGKKEEPWYVLKHNDRVGIFPPVGGG